MADLRVELYGTLVGYLTGAKPDDFDFKIESEVFSRFQLRSTVLSESIPLLPIQKTGGKKRRQNFFSELLPEGKILENLANSIGVDENDVIAILTHFGRDIAGALQIYDPNQPGEPNIPEAIKVTGEEIAKMLQNTTNAPLGNKPRLGKTSLAGVQDKIVLAKIKGTWHQVINGFPSTHIIKPESQEYPTIIYDEEYGSRIARELGLAKYETSLENFAGKTGLVVERYDRISNEFPERIHQEDMNQVLGVRKNQKYQEFGGKISLLRIAEILRNIDGRASLIDLLKLNTMAVAIGNLDLHAKNISIVHLPNEDSVLAPAYDTVPLIHHPELDGRMALAINGKYLHSQISASDIITEAATWGIKDAEKIVNQTLEIIRNFVLSESPDPRSYKNLSQEISIFCQNLLDGKSTIGA